MSVSDIHCFLYAGSVFKGGWLECPTEWTQPDLATEFETLRSIRDVSNKVLDSVRTRREIRSFLEAEVAIQTNSEELTTLLEQHIQPSAKSVEFSLSDLLVVSKASLMSEDHKGVMAEASLTSRDHNVAEEEVVYKDKACDVTVYAWPAVLSKKYKCPRCWKHTSRTDGELCGRCMRGTVHVM